MKTKMKIDINMLARENIRNLKPYQSARGLNPMSESILLDANENPFPMGYNRYPDPLQKELKTEIAKLKKISPENIFLGNGSDEVIDLLIRVFCKPGTDSVLINVPTYGMYEVCAAINDVNVIKVELDNDFQLDLSSIYKKMQKAKLIFICSPNNPTGNVIKKESILNLLELYENGLVIIDEAYIDFAEEKSFIDEIRKYPNLIILQTFSKARAMAGIRVGMGFANIEIINLLNKVKYPYNISKINQQTALKAVKENSNTIYTIDTIKNQKLWLVNELLKLKQVDKIWPSDANFILVQFKQHDKVFSFLMSSSIIVRDRSKEPKCNRCLRISVGKPQENIALINTLKDFEKLNTTL